MDHSLCKVFFGSSGVIKGDSCSAACRERSYSSKQCHLGFLQLLLLCTTVLTACLLSPYLIFFHFFLFLSYLIQNHHGLQFHIYSGHNCIFCAINALEVIMEINPSPFIFFVIAQLFYLFIYLFSGSNSDLFSLQVQTAHFQSTEATWICKGFALHQYLCCSPVFLVLTCIT